MTRRPLAALATWWLACLCAVSACRDRVATEAESTRRDAGPEVTVTVAPIAVTTLHDYVTGWGRVEPEPATARNPPANAALAAAVPGLVTAILCTEGERVQRGATLVRLDSRIADVAVERAKEAVRFAEGLVERQERLGPGEATSQRAYQEVKQQLATARSELAAAEVERRLLDVTSPIDGTVVHVGARLGDAVDPSTVLAEIIDLDRLAVDAAIRSVDARRVKAGQRIEISPGVSPSAASTGTVAPSAAATVEYVAPRVDGTTDTVLVRARVPVDSGLRPGQFVSVSIAVEERPNRLAVPVESVVEGADGPEIALVDVDTAVRTRVATGLRERGLVEVEGDGVREGVLVVVRGAYGLPPRAQVAISDR
jgi:membrane fusion protein (multidrug efflux system)